MKLEAAEFLRAVRGERSQTAFARRLGYRANPITDWENGRRFPTAEEVLRACDVVGLDVALAFSRFDATVPLERVECEEGGDRYAVADWLDRLRGSTPMSELAQRTGASRFSVSNWLSGRSRPRLPDFFRLVEAISGRLPDLVSELVPIERVPSLLERYHRFRAARTLAFDEPWTEAVLRLLETESYCSLPAHEPGWLAARLGIDQEREASALALLERAGVIAFRDGRYATVGVLTVETRADLEAMLRLRSHWAKEALRRIADPRDADLYGYNVISVTHEDLARVRERLLAAFHDIRSLVAASSPPQTAALVSMQLISWDADG